MIRAVLLLQITAFYTTIYAVSSLSNSIDDNDDVIDLSHLGPNIYGDPDNRTGEIIAAYNSEESELNPEELGNYFEGDILMPKTMTRIGLLASSAKWPNGVIPFEIRGHFGRIHFFYLERSHINCNKKFVLPLL